MRLLLYVPVIHEEVDLGEGGLALAERSARLVGKGRWELHQATLRSFWQQVAAYFLRLDARRLRLYQDGLPVDGEVGVRIVAEAARRGSRNHQLVLDLMERGAELRVTEAVLPLLQERQRLQSFLQADASDESGRPVTKYRRQRDRLLEARDRFIAGTINATLREGEVGVLFIGAEHEVAPKLAQDIVVEAIKDPQAVRAYLGALFQVGGDEDLVALARYLSEPVSAASEIGE